MRQELSQTVRVPYLGDELELGWFLRILVGEREMCLEETSLTATTHSTALQLYGIM